MSAERTIAQILQVRVLSGRSIATHPWPYMYGNLELENRGHTGGNLELENRGHTGGLRSWNSALECRLRVQVPGRGSFSLVATFKLRS